GPVGMVVRAAWRAKGCGREAMTTIPDVQTEMLNEAARLRMFGLAGEPAHLAPSLERWVATISRRRRVRRAPPTSRPMSAAIAAQIEALGEKQPARSYRTIGHPD